MLLFREHHAKQCDHECSDWDCGGCTQDDDIPGIVRFRTYEVLKQEVNNPKLRWAYLPYSMHMAGPREAIQHMIIRRNYGERHTLLASSVAYGFVKAQY